MTFDATTPPTAAQLSAASKLVVKDEDSNDVVLGDLFRDQKTIAIWIRHFYCGLCQDYITYLNSKVTPAMLEEAGVKLVIIGCGNPSLIKPYRELLQTPFAIYADPSKKTYVELGMTLRTLAQGEGDPEYIKRSGFSNFTTSIANAFKFGKVLSANSGDIKQLGGEFILGPGEECSFTHRMSNTKDHVPTADLMHAAGVAYPVKL
ncbi:hypothetical protein MNV49_002050 [Pseudohyphozyma bogoriensis]|nr:hypothetical protein MNV49_002050 [Pseudohyphozyma bogoriensis]